MDDNENKNQNPFKEEENIENSQDINEDGLLRDACNDAEAENAQAQENDSEEASSNSEVQTEEFEALNNKYIRLAADFDNYRKRTTAEKEELSTYTTIELLKKLTFVLDTFERAKDSLASIADPEKIKEGYDAVYKQLNDTLSKMGLKEMEALGAPFNPTEHEAITQVPTDEYEPDTVALVAQKGYKLNDKVVRAALVGVAVEKEN